MNTRSGFASLAFVCAAFIGSGALLLAEDPKGKEPPKPKCDLSKIETIQRCSDCSSDMENGKCRCVNTKEHTKCECKGKKVEVQMCVKSYYQCTECHNDQLKGGKCEKCGKKTEEKKSKAEIVYHCEADDVSSDKPGKCEKCKKNLAKTCKQSGTFPHAPKPDAGK